jgi:hypothetical protein
MHSTHEHLSCSKITTAAAVHGTHASVFAVRQIHTCAHKWADKYQFHPDGRRDVCTCDSSNSLP